MNTTTDGQPTPIHELIGEKAEERIKEIKDKAYTNRARTSCHRLRKRDMDYLFKYIEFLKGNRRANQDGLD